MSVDKDELNDSKKTTNESTYAGSEETIIQNKIALCGISLGSFLAIIAILEQAPQNDFKWTVYTYGCVSLLGFLLYLIFLPLRYKSYKKYQFTINLGEVSIDQNRIDRFFDISADLLPSNLIIDISSIPLFYLIIPLNKNQNVLISVLIFILYILGSGLFGFIIFRTLGIKIVKKKR